MSKWQDWGLKDLKSPEVPLSELVSGSLCLAPQEKTLSPRRAGSGYCALGF